MTRVRGACVLMLALLVSASLVFAQPSLASAPDPHQGPFLAPGPDRLAVNLGSLDRLCTPHDKAPPTAPTPGVVTPPGMTLVHNFDGIRWGDKADDNKVVGHDIVGASDTSGAAGPDDYVQMVNVGAAIFSKSGALRCGPMSQAAFFTSPRVQSNCEGDKRITDSVVMYDSHAGRWFVSLAFRTETPSFGLVQVQCIAVSQTSDPTGGWYRYEFQISGDGTCPDSQDPTAFRACEGDYPKAGVWPDAYYLTAASRPDEGHYNGVYLLAFERARMLQGQDARSVEFYIPNASGQISVSSATHFLVADWDGPTPPPEGAPEPVVQEAFGEELGVWGFHVDWTDPAKSTLSRTSDFTNQSFTGRCHSNNDTCIDQPTENGVTKQLAALADGKVMFRLPYRNLGDRQVLLATLSVLVGPGDRMGIGWYELQNGSGGWDIAQQGAYAPTDANDRWMPSIAMDHVGDILVGFNASGPTLHPSVHYAARRPSDPKDMLPVGEGSFVAGTGSQLDTEQFGDYAQTTLDPSDDCTFWYTSEYYDYQPPAGTSDPTTEHNFSTRIGAVRMDSCEASPVTPTTVRTVAPAQSPSAGAQAERALPATGSRPVAALAIGLLAAALAVGLLGRKKS